MGRRRTGRQGFGKAIPREVPPPPRLSLMDRLLKSSLGASILLQVVSACVSLSVGLSVGALFQPFALLDVMTEQTLRPLVLAGTAAGFGVGASVADLKRSGPPVVAAVVLVLGLYFSGVSGLWAAGASWLAAVALAEYLAPPRVSPRRGSG
jgi:hypothetical protein